MVIEAVDDDGDTAEWVRVEAKDQAVLLIDPDRGLPAPLGPFELLQVHSSGVVNGSAAAARAGDDTRGRLPDR